MKYKVFLSNKHKSLCNFNLSLKHKNYLNVIFLEESFLNVCLNNYFTPGLAGHYYSFKFSLAHFFK